jgi:hypothetical protein
VCSAYTSFQIEALCAVKVCEKRKKKVLERVCYHGNSRRLSLECMPFIHFPADVANKRHLDSAPKSHFCDLAGNTEVFGLSDLMTLFVDLGCLYCKQTQGAFNVFKNTQNWLKIDLVDLKLFTIKLSRVWKLLTRRWNAWHWERHCVSTAGGERVKQVALICRVRATMGISGKG